MVFGLVVLVRIAKLWPQHCDPVEDGDVDDSTRLAGWVRSASPRFSMCWDTVIEDSSLSNMTTFFFRDEAGADNSIWTKIGAPRYRRLNDDSLQQSSSHEAGEGIQSSLSGAGDRGSVELAIRYAMDEGYDYVSDVSSDSSSSSAN